MEARAKLHIQDQIESGVHDLIGSFILDYEVSQNPFIMRREAIQGFIRENMKEYVGIERESLVAIMAAEIMQTGIKEKDALHVTAAIYARCDYFISTDMRLLKYRTDRIKMVTPIEFVVETEGE